MIMTESREPCVHHAAAAMHHEQAARFHREASRHFRAGKDYALAADQALTARDHGLRALEHGQAASACHAPFEGSPSPEYRFRSSAGIASMAGAFAMTLLGPDHRAIAAGHQAEKDQEAKN
jgi:hypothetical protein